MLRLPDLSFLAQPPLLSPLHLESYSDSSIVSGFDGSGAPRIGKNWSESDPSILKRIITKKAEKALARKSTAESSAARFDKRLEYLCGTEKKAVEKRLNS